MDISMWLIAERLEDLHPITEIRKGSSVIEGIRFLPEAVPEMREKKYVYLCLMPHNDEIFLINGEDIIVIQNSNTEEVLNRLLDIFEYFTRWESSLWELSVTGSVQNVLDLGEEALKNPMILSALDGNVLAMTSVHRSQDLNENWVFCRTTGRVPTSILGMPLYDTDSNEIMMLEEPQIMYLPNHTKTIGQLLYHKNVPLAAISLWENETKITPGHIHLMRVLCTVLTSMLKDQEETYSFRSGSLIITELLSGGRIQEEVLQKIDIHCQKPWILVTIKSIFRTTVVSLNSIVQSMILTQIPCIPVVHEQTVCCLVDECHCSELLQVVFGPADSRYYSIVCSMSFTQLSQVYIRYQQNLFCFNRKQNAPRVHSALSTGMEYALSEIKEDKEVLIHPALSILKKYDQESGMDLYTTFFYYLYYERSLQQGAECVHLHRNSFLYRIKKIQEMIHVNLDDPKERNFLILSYFLDGEITQRI